MAEPSFGTPDALLAACFRFVPISALASQRLGSTSSFFSFDLGGSTRALLNAAQATTDSYLCQAFGTEQASTGSTDNSLRFGGQVGYWRDSANRIDVKGRMLEPDSGRWITRDTEWAFAGQGAYRVAAARMVPMNIITPGAGVGPIILPVGPVGPVTPIGMPPIIPPIDLPILPDGVVPRPWPIVRPIGVPTPVGPIEPVTVPVEPVVPVFLPLLCLLLCARPAGDPRRDCIVPPDCYAPDSPEIQCRFNPTRNKDIQKQIHDQNQAAKRGRPRRGRDLETCITPDGNIWNAENGELIGTLHLTRPRSFGLF